LHFIWSGACSLWYFCTRCQLQQEPWSIHTL
jgi:hypothetical protein